MKLRLMPHQVEFVTWFGTRYSGYVGGYGSGKSVALCNKGLLCAKRNPGKLGALMSPVNSMVETDLLPAWEATLDEAGVRWEYESKSYNIYKLHFPGQAPSRVQLMSAENHNRLRGKNLAWWGVDEFATIKPRSLQKLVLQQLQARLRDGYSIDSEHGFFVTTPEGFEEVHHFFVTAVELEKKRCTAEGEEYVPDRRLFKVRTADNYLLKPTYIKDLQKQYPPQLLQAYLEGEFVNLTQGAVWELKPEFEPAGNFTRKTASDFPDHPLHVGCDFNGPRTGGSSACIYIIDNSKWYMVDEVMGARRTREMAQTIRARYPDRDIYCHPDKSGGQESANSERTNFDHLLEAGFELYTEDRLGKQKNPDVSDRINCTNGLMCNGFGERFWFINPETCPVSARAFQQQPYGDDNKPLKDGVYDGPTDAGTYPLWNLHATSRSTFRSGHVNG